MGVIQKKVGGESDKKKNKVKANIKNKLETNTKFPKVKNQKKPKGPKENGEKVQMPKKKKFEKNIQKGSPPGGSPKSKQDGNKSPKQKKNKKNKKGLKQKPDKVIDTEIGDAILTVEETEAAIIKAAKLAKTDNDRINDLLTKILTKNETKPKEIEPIKAKGLQLEELISKDILKKHVKSFMKIVNHAKSQPEYKSKLLKDKRMLTLSILAMKIPDCSNKNSKIKLPVPLFSTDSEICLFVADLLRGRKRDDEPFVRHYEEILENNGVTCINKVMTVSHLIKEYSTYELKARLANTYDVFLVEGKISNRVGTFVGSIFGNIKRNPIPIKDFTKESIENALNSVTYRRSGLGPVNVINFAHDEMTDSEVTENLYSLIQQLKKIYPGGWSNIKSLTLTALKDLAYPIMYNFAFPNDIPVPKLKSIQDVKIQKAKQLLDGELQKIEITGNGLIVKKKFKRNFEESELSNSENEEDFNPIVESTDIDSSLAKPKKKKKKNGVKEPEPIETKIEPEEILAPKKDKKKKKNKELLVEEEEAIVEMPKIVQVIKKQKKDKKNKTNSLVNIKPSQKAKFEKTTADGVKPKKKKINKAN